jgi:hypothetical protein
MAQHRPRIFAASFTILHPRSDQCVNPDQGGTIVVRVQDRGLGNTRYHATITASGSGLTGGDGDLAQEGSGSQFFSASLSVGPVPATASANNRSVTVTGFSGSHQESETIDFRVQSDPCGSGSGSGSGIAVLTAAAHRCQFCQPDEPIPVALTLQLDTPVSAGTCADCDRLNQPTALRHSRDPGFPCSWLSQPIDFCSDRANPALWVLRKTDETTWTLVLQRGSSTVVTYRLTTPALDCSFPIRLQIAGAGGPECKDWPRTVTVTPAP